MRQLGREHIVVPEGINLVNFNKMISFNDSAAYLWESTGDKEFNAEDIKNLLLDKYEVEPDVAGNDAEKIIRNWLDAGLITE